MPPQVPPAPRKPYPSPAPCPSHGLPEQSPSAFLKVPHTAFQRGLWGELHSLLMPREEPSPLPPTPPPPVCAGPGPASPQRGGRLDRSAVAAATAAISGVHLPSRAGRERQVGALTPFHSPHPPRGRGPRFTPAATTRWGSPAPLSEQPRGGQDRRAAPLHRGC